MKQIQTKCFILYLYFVIPKIAAFNRSSDHFLTQEGSVAVIFKNEENLIGIHFKPDNKVLVLQHDMTDFEIREDVCCVTFDATNKELYFVGEGNNMYKYGTNIGLHAVLLDTEGCLDYDSYYKKISDIALDWVTGNVYFLQSMFCQIFVCNKNFSCGIVFRETRQYNCDHFAKLALDPTNRKMYWTSRWTPTIWSAGMDGSAPSILVSGDMYDPFTIVINYYDNCVYWTDLIKRTIESCNMRGGDRKIVHTIEYLSEQVHLNFFRNTMYWTDNSGEFIWLGDLTVDGVVNNTNSISIAVKEDGWEMEGIVVANAANQPQLTSNPCLASTCSDICTLSADINKQYRCICPGRMKLSEDLFTCIGHETESAFPDSMRNAKLLLTDTLKLEYGGSNDLKKFKRVKSITGSFNENSANITYDIRRNTVYWLGNGFERTILFKWDVREDEAEVVIDTGLSDPVAIAMDWITSNLYIQDRGLGKIFACNNASNPCSVAFDLNDGFHQGIALDPTQGHMYWSMTFGIDENVEGVIYKAGMDGSDAKQIISLGRQVPVGLIVDFRGGLLFWSNLHEETIESCDLDGSDHRIVLIAKNSGKSSFLDIFEDDLILHKRLSNQFWVINIRNNGSREWSCQTTHMRGIKMELEGLVVADLAKQPLTRNNSCADSECSHACALAPDIMVKSFRCMCPRGMILDHNRKTCQDEKSAPLLVIGYNNVLTFKTLGFIGKQQFESVTLLESVSLGEIKFNAVTNSLFLLDNALNQIIEFNIGSRNFTSVTLKELDAMSGFDIDVVAQNLYFISSQKQTIEVMSLDSKAKMTLKDGFKNGQDIAVVPERGILFVAQMREDSGIIWKMSMTAEEGEIIVSSENVYPNILFFDRDSEYMFWVDENENNINMIRNNITINVFEGYFFNATTDVVVFENQIYWSSMYSNEIFCKNLRSDSGGFVFEASEYFPTSGFRLAVISDLKTSSIWDIVMNHECSKQNSNRTVCSHICLTTNELEGKCVCPTGMIIDYDGKTCLDCLDERYSERCRKNETNDAESRQSHTIFIAVTSIVLFGVMVLVIWMLGLWVHRKNQIISDLEIREFRNGRNIENYAHLEDNHIFYAKYNTDFEIGNHEFVKETSTIIGEGNFGVVYKSYMSRYNDEVAVKVPKSAIADEVRSVLCEIKILSYVGEHPNVVKLLGAYTKELKKGNVFIVTELCNNGPLIKYLNTIAENISTDVLLQTLFRFCEEIATGMEYLADKNVIHGDLAARNVLLGENYSCKISDFGLSRKLGRYAKYIKKTNEPLPWAWLAVESLSDLEFTLKSDIWSMGVTFWEIFTLGAEPYPGETFDLAFIDGLKNGRRLQKPNLLSDEEFTIILQCWAIDPKDRPDARSIRINASELRNQHAVSKEVTN